MSVTCNCLCYLPSVLGEDLLADETGPLLDCRRFSTADCSGAARNSSRLPSNANNEFIAENSNTT